MKVPGFSSNKSQPTGKGPEQGKHYKKQRPRKQPQKDDNKIPHNVRPVILSRCRYCGKEPTEVTDAYNKCRICPRKVPPAKPRCHYCGKELDHQTEVADTYHKCRNCELLNVIND